jgi:hypothetical protein
VAHPKTPAQYAEAPPNDPTHPAVVKRWVEDMTSLANLADAAPAETFAGEDAWYALQRLRVSLEKVSDEAELGRRPEPSVYPRI